MAEPNGKQQIGVNDLKAVAYNIHVMVNEFITIITQQANRIAELEKQLAEKGKE